MQTVTVSHSTTLDVPDYGARLDIDQLIELVKRSGSHFFDSETMRFFRSRVDAYTVAGPDGWYFVTSEKHVSPYSRINEARKYTVRRFSVGPADVELAELEAFQRYPTLQRARTAARVAAKRGTVKCATCRYRLVLEGSKEGICGECLERDARRRA